MNSFGVCIVVTFCLIGSCAAWTTATNVYTPLPTGVLHNIYVTYSILYYFTTANPAAVVFSDNFISTLAAESQTNDLYTLIQGDPQLWWHCEQYSTLCIALSNNCSGNATGDDNSYTPACNLLQGQISNLQQYVGCLLSCLIPFMLQMSINALVSQMQTAMGKQPQVLIINGDLTANGEAAQLYAFNTQWPAVIGVSGG